MKDAKQQSGIRWLYRVISYLLGMLLLAFGVAFAVNSNLGVSPVNSLPYAVSLVSGFSMGNCVIAVFIGYILIQILLLRRNFKPKNLLQIVFSTIFGYFVDFGKWLVGDFALPTYFGQLAMLAISILLISLGLVFYLTADIVPMPMEGMAMAITSLQKKLAFHNVKIVVDCTSVLLAVLITWLGTGSIQGVREGTVITALVAGKVMALLSKPLKPHIERICFGAPQHLSNDAEQEKELEAEANI